MEELIELIKAKYNNPITLTIYSNGVVSLTEEEEHYINDSFIDFDSLEDLRNHLNEQQR